MCGQGDGRAAGTKLTREERDEMKCRRLVGAASPLASLSALPIATPPPVLISVVIFSATGSKPSSIVYQERVHHPAVSPPLPARPSPPPPPPAAVPPPRHQRRSESAAAAPAPGMRPHAGRASPRDQLPRPRRVPVGRGGGGETHPIMHRSCHQAYAGGAPAGACDPGQSSSGHARRWISLLLSYLQVDDLACTPQHSLRHARQRSAVQPERRRRLARPQPIQKHQLLCRGGAAAPLLLLLLLLLLCKSRAATSTACSATCAGAGLPLFLPLHNHCHREEGQLRAARQVLRLQHLAAQRTNMGGVTMWRACAVDTSTARPQQCCGKAGLHNSSPPSTTSQPCLPWRSPEVGAQHDARRRRQRRPVLQRGAQQANAVCCQGAFSKLIHDAQRPAGSVAG